MTEVAFNETIASTYDADSAEMFDTGLLESTVGFLAPLAGNGAALELGIGTGRVALPLSQRGISVHGIDVSESMVARMRAKPGGEGIPVTFGDIATTRAPGSFQLVYLPFNIITNLLTQAEQVLCLQNAAAHLVPGGFVVAEVWIPTLQRLHPGERFVPFKVTPGHLGFDEIDVANQLCTSHHYFVRDEKTQVFQSHHRYVWPAELDLMAQLAGLEFRERWADWRRSPFTSTSTDQISVWQKPPASGQEG
jgi:SAM-dependent methyltransferase